ncbi:uncharacterized protein BDZ99DRAFT_460638 [Mytilinidion resinicola]|uniref:Uncharacterized protein n=1 Tax=Mytilinidion resinicola TaxID=574789 RepID=A0A6A6YZK0_9PEZI|nr:uncharacterized protein BDZ99DRAFT_460638 [Mytilinidion resinicola]KAF2813387.1 hypothetical protein BDZ99DRAFT_460638 [Mytilinidion resinicola]
MGLRSNVLSSKMPSRDTHPQTITDCSCHYLAIFCSYTTSHMSPLSPLKQPTNVPVQSTSPSPSPVHARSPSPPTRQTTQFPLIVHVLHAPSPCRLLFYVVA